MGLGAQSGAGLDDPHMFSEDGLNSPRGEGKGAESQRVRQAQPGLLGQLLAGRQAVADFRFHVGDSARHAV